MPFIGKQPAEAALVTGDLGDDIVTLAKMAAGTDGQIITYDASGNPAAVGPGSDGQVLPSTGAGSPPAFENAGLTLGTEAATTSGSSVTIGSIPSGVKFIVVSLAGVSIGADHQSLGIQLGDAGGLESANYVGLLHVLNSTTSAPLACSSSFLLISGSGVAAANNFNGSLILTLEDSSNFTWAATGGISANAQSSDRHWGQVNGTKALSAELTQVALISSGTFDAGAFNIAYM